MNIPPILIRVGVVVLALAAWHWTQRLIAQKSAPRHGLGDLVHDLTARWHGWLRQNDRAANRLLIVSSFFIDVLGLSVIGMAVFGGSFAPFIALLILFSLRQLSQALCSLPPPPGMIWRHPGCPSLLVTYEVGNDFFFSGHTALAVLGALTVAHAGPAWLAIAVIIVALGEMAAVLLLRAHYTLDVIAGAAVAFFAHHMAARVAPVIDLWLR
ncbi:MAG: phosphatase PAP2 family protein [Prosthecobacter sp.]|jgi:hypothetical protein|uniref:phosphatase PAP2-related protein n=1 Tax=Prosthecobacter sp. TaxID=1965333 RepID=UPI0019EB7535|nr:phosphatase PAP2-related protein [Prosthecobacter sp.]MBE2287333.1 phosphatase PAP2 family protein [Prosthecobacter sp.]